MNYAIYLFIPARDKFIYPPGDQGREFYKLPLHGLIEKI